MCSDKMLMLLIRLKAVDKRCRIGSETLHGGEVVVGILGPWGLAAISTTAMRRIRTFFPFQRWLGLGRRR